MKHIFIILFCLIFIFFPNFTKAELADSAITDVRDSFPAKKASKGFDLIAICGLGMTTGSSYDDWEYSFKNGPSLLLGVELPFTRSHVFALELFEHFWISKKTENSAYPTYYDDFIKLGKDSYSQLGFVAAIKCYFFKKSFVKLRPSISLGWLFLSQSKHYSGIEFSFGLNYTMSENLTISLTRRIIDSFNSPLSGSSELVPNFLFLNLSYNFQLGRK